MLRTLASRGSRALGVASRRMTTVTEPGPVGLYAGDNPRQTLSELYQKTLEAVKEFPDTAAYRSNVEKITNYRLSVVNDNEDIDKIESILNVGQIQEVIEQAEDELELIPHMAEWKPWQLHDDEKPVNIEVLD